MTEVICPSLVTVRALAAAGLLLVVAGCSSTSGESQAEVSEAGKQYLLANEPDDAVSVLDAREEIAGEQELSVVGQIGGVADPWIAGKAAFYMIDPSAAMEADEHDHCTDANCPFCAKRKEQEVSALAVVQLVDAQGKTIRQDARSLLGLAPDQVVVVRGRAKVDEVSGQLRVSATGLFIRR